MKVGWLSISRQLLRRRAGYRPLVLAVGLGFAVAVLATAVGQRVARHAHEMSVMPAEARVQITVSGREADAAADLAALRAIPGVRGASWVEAQLRSIWNRPELFDGGAGRFVGWVIPADESAAGTLDLRLVAGRLPSGADLSAPVVPLLVSRSFLAELGPGAGPGTRLRSVERAREAEVVGVVDDFMSHGAMKTSRNTVVWPAQPHGVIRTYLVRSGHHDVDEVVSRAATVLDRPGRWVQVERTDEMLAAQNRPLLGAQGVLVVLVAIVVGTLLLGLAAAAAFRVVERRRELAVQRALGATQADIVVAVLAESTAVTSMGLLAGLALVLVLHGPMSRAIPFFTIHGATLAMQALLFFAAGWLASLAPALRAARVPPVAAGR